MIKLCHANDLTFHELETPGVPPIAVIGLLPASIMLTETPSLLTMAQSTITSIIA